MPGETTTNGANGHNGTSNGVSSAMDVDAESQFDSIPEVIRDFRDNKFVIVLDSPSRENEGDLIIAAENITPAQMSFLIRHTSGYICVPVPVTRTAELGLKQMVEINKDPNKTAYTISVDAAVKEITTGISAHDRALTCRMLADQNCKAEAFRKPGHIIPLQARKGGVRVRPGHTEAAVDLCRLAGKEPVGVICEMVIDGEAVDGTPELVGGGMMRRDECLAFGKQWGIKVCTIEALVRYIKETQGEYIKEEEETRMAVGI